MGDVRAVCGRLERDGFRIDGFLLARQDCACGLNLWLRISSGFESCGVKGKMQEEWIMRRAGLEDRVLFDTILRKVEDFFIFYLEFGLDL